MKFPQTPEIGTKVFIKKGGYGATGVDGRTGVVVNASTTINSGVRNTGIKIQLDGGAVWGLNLVEYDIIPIHGNTLTEGQQKTAAVYNVFNNLSNDELTSALNAAGVRPLSQSRSMMLQQSLIVWFHGSIPDLTYLTELFREQTS